MSKIPSSFIELCIENDLSPLGIKYQFSLGNSTNIGSDSLSLCSCCRLLHNNKETAGKKLRKYSTSVSLLESSDSKNKRHSSINKNIHYTKTNEPHKRTQSLVEGINNQPSPQIPTNTRSQPSKTNNRQENNNKKREQYTNIDLNKFYDSIPFEKGKDNFIAVYTYPKTSFFEEFYRSHFTSKTIKENVEFLNLLLDKYKKLKEKNRINRELSNEILDIVYASDNSLTKSLLIPNNENHIEVLRQSIKDTINLLYENKVEQNQNDKKEDNRNHKQENWEKNLLEPNVIKKSQDDENSKTLMLPKNNEGISNQEEEPTEEEKTNSSEKEKSNKEEIIDLTIDTKIRNNPQNFQPTLVKSSSSPKNWKTSFPEQINSKDSKDQNNKNNLKERKNLEEHECEEKDGGKKNSKKKGVKKIFSAINTYAHRKNKNQKTKNIKNTNEHKTQNQEFIDQLQENVQVEEVNLAEKKNKEEKQYPLSIQSKENTLNMFGKFTPYHLNLVNVYSVVERELAFHVIVEYKEYNLESVVRSNLKYFQENDIERRFLLFQMYQCISFLFKKKLSFFRYKASNIMLDKLLWVTIPVNNIIYYSYHYNMINNKLKKSHELETIGKEIPSDVVKTCSFDSKNKFKIKERVAVLRSSGVYTYGIIVEMVPYSNETTEGIYHRVFISSRNASKSIFKDLTTPNIGKFIETENRLFQHKKINSIISKTVLRLRTKISDVVDIYRNEAVLKWQNREISNFEYLMVLNQIAGRKIGNFKYHPIFPWVTDFKERNSFRDLTKSKFRLNKGDQMLDLTFKSKNPHHVTEPLSEITYFSYLARKTPVSDLTKYVRTKFEPKEYPKSMERLYEWTPEECIPQFFYDDTIFKSIHKEMTDLELPSWTKNSQSFISYHREVLESDYVSANLHHWIDIMFGYKLVGTSAIKSKNLMLKQTQDTYTRKSGYVQVFFEPHPRRKYNINSVHTDEKYLNYLLLDHQLKNMNLFEDCFQFSSKYFQTSAYYLCSNQPPENEEISDNAPGTASKKSTETKQNNQNEVLLMLERILDKKIENEDKVINTLDSDEDLFNYGCVLAEIYQSKSLFTRRSIKDFLSSEFIPNTRNLPYLVKEIVESLLNIDTENYSRKNKILLIKKLFPSNFDFIYSYMNTLRIEHSDEQIKAIIKGHMSIMLQMPLEEFELICYHIISIFFNDKSKWELLLECISEQKILKRFELCRKIKNILKSIVFKFFTDSQNPKVQSIVFGYPFTKFIYEIFSDSEEKQFLEKILPFHIEHLMSMNSMSLNYYNSSLFKHTDNTIEIHDENLTQKNVSFNISNVVLNTLYNLSKNDFGIILTLQHVIEPIFDIILRKYKASLNKYSKKDNNKNTSSTDNPHLVEQPIKNFSNNDFLFSLYIKLLIDIAQLYGINQMISYYLPKLFSVLEECINSTTRVVNRKEKLNDSSSSIRMIYENQTEKISGIFIVFHSLIKKSQDENTTSMMNFVFQHNIELMEGILKKYKYMSVEIFEKYIETLRHMLLLCEPRVSHSVLLKLQNIFSEIFCCEIDSTEDTHNLSFEESIRDSTNEYSEKNNTLSSDSNSDSSPNEILKMKRVTLKSNPMEKFSTVKRKGSSIASFIKSFAITSTHEYSEPDSYADEIENEYDEPSKELDCENNATSSSKSTIDTDDPKSVLMNENYIDQKIEKEDENSSKTVQESKKLKEEKEKEATKRVTSDAIHFQKACILYREMCCIFGNSNMRSMLLNSYIFERHLHEQAQKALQDTHLISSPASPQIPLTKPKRNKENSLWIQFENREILNHLCSNSSTSQFRFRGVLEKEFSDVEETQHSKLKTKRNIFSKFDIKEGSIGNSPRRAATGKNLNRMSVRPRSNMGVLGNSKRNSIAAPFTFSDNTTETANIQSIDVFYRNERIIASGGKSNVKIWDIEKGKPVLHFNDQTIGNVSAVRFFSSYHSNNLIGCDGMIHIWDVETGKKKLNKKNVKPFTCFDCFGEPEPNLICTGDEGGYLRFIDSRTESVAFGWKLSLGENSNKANLRVLRFHSDDQHLCIGLSNGVIFLLEKKSGLLVDSFVSHSKEVTKIIPYGKNLFFSCSSDCKGNSPSIVLNCTSVTPCKSVLHCHVPMVKRVYSTNTTQDKKNTELHQQQQQYQTQQEGNQSYSHISPFVSFDVNPQYEQLLAVNEQTLFHSSLFNYSLTDYSYLEDNSVEFTDALVPVIKGGISAEHKVTPVEFDKHYNENVVTEYSQGNLLSSSLSSSGIITNVNSGMNEMKDTKAHHTKVGSTLSTSVSSSGKSYTPSGTSRKSTAMNLGEVNTLRKSLFSSRNKPLKNNFTDVKMLPMHKLVVTSSQDGKLRVYS